MAGPLDQGPSDEVRVLEADIPDALSPRPPEWHERRIVGAVARRLNLTGGRSDMALTVLGGFSIQALTLVSGALVARMLGVENRGDLALLFVVALVVIQLGSLGIPQSITYWTAKQPTSARPMVRGLARPGVVMVVVLIATQALVLALVESGSASDVRLAALYSLGVIPAALAQQTALSLMQGQRTFRAFNVIRLFPSGSYSVGVVVLFIFGIGNLPRVALVWTVSYLVVGVSALVFALRRLPRASGNETLPTHSEMARFGMKGLLGATSPIDTFNLDQAVVGLFVSTTALGLYVAAVAFTNFPRLIAQNIGFVAFPRIAAQRDEDAAWKLIWRCAALTIAVCGVMVVALEIITPRLVYFFYGSAFKGSIGLARLLLISAFLAGVRRVVSDGARGAGRPGIGTIGEVASWVSLCVVLPVFIPLAGVNGVAISLGIASAFGLAVLLVGLLWGHRRRPRGS